MNILIISPSWEERSYLGLENNIKELDIRKICIIKYTESLLSSETEIILKHIKEIAIRLDVSICYLMLQNNVTEKWIALSSFVSNLNLVSEDHIYLDITTMSRNVIWAILFFLRQNPHTINVVYYQPQSYSSTWVSKEPDVPRLLFKHSGIYRMGLPTALIILTGFDPERTKQIIRYYEPQKVILGVQKGEQFSNSTLNNCTVHKKSCIGLIDVNSICDFEFDAYSHDNGFDLINKQVELLLEKYNIIVSSHGPKLSAISLYKCFLRHNEIALSYLPCKEYNRDYCQGIGGKIIATIDENFE